MRRRLLLQDRRPFAGRVTTLGYRLQSCTRPLSGIREAKARVGAKGELAGLSIRPIPHGPAFGAGWLDDQVEARQRAIGNFETLAGSGFCNSTARAVKAGI